VRAIELFRTQLDDESNPPCDGDFLQGKDPNLVIAEWEKTPLLGDRHRAELVQLLARYIREYRQHVGEHLLYFVEYDPDDEYGGHPAEIWEKNVEKLWDSHVLLVPPFLGNSALPRFQRKV
jgi:hypothetical protein